jgi:hypothetical protein
MSVTATDLETCDCMLTLYKEVSGFKKYLDGEADHVDAVLEGPVLSLTDSLEELDIVDGSVEAIHMDVLGHSLQKVSEFHGILKSGEGLQQPSMHRLR